MARSAAALLRAFIGVQLLMLSSVFAAGIPDRMSFWLETAYMCSTENGSVRFPSKRTGILEQPCDDGDMTLFNGLLCAAGEAKGCDGVAEAFEPSTGQWFRSPRIRRSGNDRGGADFSPDMALGVYLYLAKTRDVSRATKWLEYLHRINPTRNPIDTILPPKLCGTFDCTLRPGDGAILSVVVDHFQKLGQIPEIPNGRLRGFLGTTGGYSTLVVSLGAANDPGFPQHLTAASLFLLRSLGNKDPQLDTAARVLALRNPKNAFFAYLAGAPREIVETLVLEKCPATAVDLSQYNEWQWERTETDKDGEVWKRSMLWDCVFMGRLLDN